MAGPSRPIGRSHGGYGEKGTAETPGPTLAEDALPAAAPSRGRLPADMLIWGDSELGDGLPAGSSSRGKIDLIYIDPPFDVGADFTMQVQIGDDRRR